MNTTHFVYCPFTGLGLYNGFRGNRWLRNRIEVFKEYTCRALEAQTDQDFTLWISWRQQERTNPQVIALKKWLDEKFKTVFTYSGVCFWDDKYEDDVAHDRLVTSLHLTMSELIDYVTEDEVLVTLQPSDDCYVNTAFSNLKGLFNNYPDSNAIGYSKGYIMNYQTKEISEYNPTTNPPFFTIKFPKATFIDPKKHMDYIGPYKSHEFIPNYTKYMVFDERGFIVGTHGENISTYYDHPFKGDNLSHNHSYKFGIEDAPKLQFNLGWKRYILRKLPHPIRRKIRYWFNEKIYVWLRG